MGGVEAMTLAGRTTHVPPTAERVVEGDTHSVELDLRPIARALLTDLGKAMGTSEFLDLHRVAYDGSSGLLGQTLDRILADSRVTECFRVPLTPEAADDLGTALYAAVLEPPFCEHCRTNYAQVGMYCGPCDDGLHGKGDETRDDDRGI